MIGYILGVILCGGVHKEECGGDAPAFGGGVKLNIKNGMAVTTNEDVHFLATAIDSSRTYLITYVMIHTVYKLLSYVPKFFFLEERARVTKTPPTADASGRRGKMHKMHRAATAQDAEKSTKTLFQGKHIKIYNIRCALFSHFSGGETRKLTLGGRNWLSRK